MSSAPGSIAGLAVAQFAVGPQTQIAVLPLHPGHHSMWASPGYQLDICNMADDWVIMDQLTGLRYRIPIVDAVIAQSQTLIGLMNAHDYTTGNPWRDHNAAVRAAMLDGAINHRDDRAYLINFYPGLVAPAIGVEGMSAVDRFVKQLFDAGLCVPADE